MASYLIDEYRQRFADFSAELNREEFLYLSGRKSEFEKNRIYSDHSDLFTLSKVDELRAALNDVDSYRETERTAFQLLIQIALDGFLKFQIRDVSDEIHSYESRATIKWKEETIGFRKALSELSKTSDTKDRHDLYARLSEVIKGTQDLRAERLEKLHEAAKQAGYESYLALFQETRGIDYGQLAASLTSILFSTESQYVSALAPLLAADANISLDEATNADLSYLLNITKYDEHFPLESLHKAYAETLAGLGVRTQNQANIEIISLDQNSRRRAFHSLIRVPDEIKLCIRQTGGRSGYQTFLHEAGHTQFYAWTSRNLYPEFRYGGDYAAKEGFAFLFGYLIHDANWLQDFLGFAASAEFLYKTAVHKLLLLRRYIAKLNYEVEVHAGKLSGVGERYSELMTEAVRMRYGATEHLRDLSDDFFSGDCLRAWAFEAQLREFLKEKYGNRWWTSRKAGELLIDVWNT
ncbi:MAG TPA: hypothetical protein VEF04_19640, partial [Blastocatellia bacterium]|nr:hypothetical protein [Blastocatellia bacterium]